MAKRKTFFSELSAALDSVSADLLKPSLPQSVLDVRRAQLGLLQEMDRYVKAGFWAGQDRSRERLQYYLLNNRDVDKTAAAYSTSAGAIRVFVSKLNAKLVAKLGDTLIDTVMSGDVGQATTDFRMATGDLRILDLIVSDVVMSMPASGYSPSVKVSDCVKELSFLRYFTSDNVRGLAKGMDADRMAFLRYVLESRDPAYSYTRQAILRYLKGTIATPEELLKLLG